MQKLDSDGAENIQQQSLVFFDLETTGLGQACEMVQLAAVSGGHSLNLFVIPRGQIQRGAARVTGFSVHRRRLYLHRQLVLTNSLREVLVSFIAFLRMLGRPLVVGHNIRRFDCPLLARALDELDLRAQFESSVSGCVDTLPLARELLRGRGVHSFRQTNLVRELLGVDYKAHDALEDVRALQALFDALQPTAEVICRHRFTLDTMETPVKAPGCPPDQNQAVEDRGDREDGGDREVKKDRGDRGDGGDREVKKDRGDREDREVKEDKEDREDKEDKEDREDKENGEDRASR